nr:unnamed protein product [Spirometra erinaceieuropaei]
MTKQEIEREVNILRSINHQNIVKLHGFYEEDMNFVLLLELVAGGELFARVAELEKLPEEEASFFVTQILRGVEHLHQLGIVHLDLKPENIMIEDMETKRIKIIDFGLARQLTANETLQDMAGTPEFCAPEIVTFDPITFATDMWAIGVMTYILLSGISPFAGDSQIETFQNILECAVTFDREEFDEVSAAARDFMDRLLQKNPKKRATAAESLRHAWIQSSCTTSESQIPVIQRMDLPALKNAAVFDNCSSILSVDNKGKDDSRKSSAENITTEGGDGGFPILNGTSPISSGSPIPSRRESGTKPDLPVVVEVNGTTTVASALKPALHNSHEEKPPPTENSKVPTEVTIPVNRIPSKETTSENLVSQMKNAHITSVGQMQSGKPAESNPPPPTVKANGLCPSKSAPRTSSIPNGSIHSRHLGGVSLLERAAKWIEAKNQSLDAYAKRLPPFRPSAPSKMNAFIAARSSFVTASSIAERRLAFTKETTVSGFRWRMVGDSENTAAKRGNATT